VPEIKIQGIILLYISRKKKKAATKKPKRNLKKSLAARKNLHN
jgi:hypothetical protein